MKKILPYFIIISAVLLRCLTYFRNRSLFYDEINLARNYAEKDYFSLLGNLDYNQHAPPFFSWVVKFFTDIFGMNEYALRLFPFAAGVASILLFHRIARRFLEFYGLAFALILFGFSSYLLEYGTEVKQYSTDVFWTCLLVYFALKFKENQNIFWAIIGSFAIWFSMPAVFILAGIGFYFAYEIYQKEGLFFSRKMLHLAGIITCWLISFGLLYIVNLQYSLGSNHLEGFHDVFFLKIDNLTQTGENLVGIIRSIVGRTAVPIVFAFGCFFLGLRTLFLKNRGHFILLATPISLCLFASFLQQYSLIVRLTIFMFPLLISFVSIGFSKLYEYSTAFKKPIRQLTLMSLTALAFLCFAGRSALVSIWQPLVKEDARSILQNLSERDLSTETLLVTDCGKPGFLFYTKYHEPSIQINAKKLIIQEEYTPLSADIPDTSFWLFDSHTFGKNYEVLRSEIKELGVVKEEIKSKSAFALFLKKSGGE